MVAGGAGGGGGVEARADGGDVDDALLLLSLFKKLLTAIGSRSDRASCDRRIALSMSSIVLSRSSIASRAALLGAFRRSSACDDDG